MVKLRYLVLSIWCISCNTDDTPKPDADNSIAFFGFTLVDTAFDDPTDSDTKTNYADEVASFTNIADVFAFTPTTDIKSSLDTFKANDLKAIIHLNEIFFELIDTNSESGANYNLRADYESRWNIFSQTNDLSNTINQVAAFYLGEEPTWNGIDTNEFKIASDFLKTQFPNVPILLIEAYPALNQLQVPESVDWVGFDHYFIKDPLNDTTFANELELVKSKMTSQQKLVLVMDTHYIDFAHGDFGTIQLAEMGEVANSYYELAQKEKAIAIIGYHWPNGFEFDQSIGARGMPENVMQVYQKIGKEISQKP